MERDPSKIQTPERFRSHGHVPTGCVGSYFLGSAELSRASQFDLDDGDASEWRSTAKFINFLDSSDSIRVKQTIYPLVAPT